MIAIVFWVVNAAFIPKHDLIVHEGQLIVKHSVTILAQRPVSVELVQVGQLDHVWLCADVLAAHDQLAAALFQVTRVARCAGRVALHSSDEGLAQLGLGLGDEIGGLLIALSDDIFFLLLGCNFCRQILYLCNQVVLGAYSGWVLIARLTFERICVVVIDI